MSYNSRFALQSQRNVCVCAETSVLRFHKRKQNKMKRITIFASKKRDIKAIYLPRSDVNVRRFQPKTAFHSDRGSSIPRVLCLFYAIICFNGFIVVALGLDGFSL